MIVSGGARNNSDFYAVHLMRVDTNERVHIADMRGFAAEDVDGAFQEIIGLASGTRCKNPFYVVSINPRENEHLTAEQWNKAVDLVEHHLGLDGQARMVIEHEKNGRTHQHVVWSRIDVETMGVISDSFNYRRHEQASRELEELFGLEPVESVLVKDREKERPDRRPSDMESFRGQGTGIDPRKMKAEITALWQEADSGLAFKAALEDAGYILAKGDRRDFVIVDPAGDEHSLARRISGEKAAGIRERMTDVDRDALPSVAEARELARAATDSTDADAEQDTAQPDELLADLKPEAQRDDDGLTAESQTHNEPGDIYRSSPWGNAWRMFSDKARALSATLLELWDDETSGTQDGTPGPWTRLVDAGRHIASGWTHRDGVELVDGIAAAASVVREILRTAEQSEPDHPPPDEHHREQSRPSADVEAPEPDERPQQATGEAIDARAPMQSDFDRMAAEYAAGMSEDSETIRPDTTSDAEPNGSEPNGPEPEGWDIEP